MIILIIKLMKNQVLMKFKAMITINNQKKKLKKI